MTTRVGINGFGRIGRAFTRLALDRADLQVVAVNDITDAATLAHLLDFDSTFGRLGRKVGHSADSLIIDGEPVPVLSERDPASIDWRAYAADVVIECTGKFRSRDAGWGGWNRDLGTRSRTVPAVARAGSPRKPG